MRPAAHPSRRALKRAPQDEVSVCGKNSERLHVTQRPGCNNFATSVSTLTVGSQATAILRSGLRSAGLAGAGGRLRASLATETRTRIEVSVRLSTFIEIVRVGD